MAKITKPTATAAALISVVSVVVLGYFIGGIDPETGFPDPITVDGQTIEFTWTDDNTNEDLKIYTDKQTYTDGISHAEVYVAVENTTAQNQDVELLGYFRGADRKLVDAYILTEYKETYMQNDNEYGCNDEQYYSTTTNQTETRQVCGQQIIATTTESTRTFLKWDPVPVVGRSPLDVIAENEKIKVNPFARKPVEGFAAGKKTEPITAAPGEVLYFKLIIDFPRNIDDNFYIEAIGSKGAYGHLDPWFSASWTYRVSITVDATQIGSTLSSFPVYVDLSDLPASFFTNAKSDGCDIRVVESDETTETAFELVDYDAGGTGELHFMADSLSSSVDTVFYIYYGNSGASCYATSATYGAEAVWVDYTVVLHMQDDPSGGTIYDSTANGNDATVTGSMTSGDLVTSPMGAGYALQFDGTDDILTIADNASIGAIADEFNTAWTSMAWMRYDSTGDYSMPALWWKFDGVGWTQNFRAGEMYFQPRYNATFEARIISDTSGAYDDGNWHMIHATNGATWTSADFNIYNNGTETSYYSDDDDLTAGHSIANSADMYVVSATAERLITADEFRLKAGQDSDDWISAEYTNQSNTTTFYTAGTEETDGGGGSSRRIITVE